MSLGIKWHSLIKEFRNGENKLVLIKSALKSPTIKILLESNESVMA